MDWGTILGILASSGGIAMLANWVRGEWQQAPYVEASANRASDAPGVVDLAIRISNRSVAPLQIDSYRVILPETGPSTRRQPRRWRDPFNAFGERRVAGRIEPFLPGATRWPAIECADRVNVGFIIVGDLELDIRMVWRRFGRTHDSMRIKLPIKPPAAGGGRRAV